jgi:DnaJ like chaperone protein
MICKKCNKENDKGNKFCIYCGTSLNTSSRQSSNFQNHKTNRNVKYCLKCGVENEKVNNFCTNCANNEFTAINLSDFENTIAGCVATLSAYIAKTDNVITQAEANLISDMFTRLSNNDENIRKSLKYIFNKAKDIPNKSHTFIASKLYTAIINNDMDSNGRDILIKALGFYFMELVYIDGDFNPLQDKTVVEILISLKISNSEINNIRKEFVHEEQQSYNRNSSSSNTNPSLQEAYNILNCKSSNSDEDIKKAYKELAKQYHPDTVSSKGLAEDFIKFANQRFQEINNAYDVIKKSRGMR